MKRPLLLTLLLLVLTSVAALAQAPTPPAVIPPGAPPNDFTTRLQRLVSNAQSPEQSLTRFDLDFPGGDPKNLVGAIQAALRRPINAIIPDDLAATQIPALKMKNVTIAQLFDALGAASQKTEDLTNAYGNHMIAHTSYGFRTQGPPTDDSIWFFYVDRPAVPDGPLPPPKICRFYSLAPYLDAGVNVDDITTAIKTGWDMLGDKSTAAIRFHKDTKLLIAVGEPSKLETIDAVLKALGTPKPKPSAGL